MSFDPRRDYPLGTRRPDLVRSPTGRPLAELKLDGDVSPEDLRATPETLRLQADVARAAERPQLADGLVRAAELASIPDGSILEVYTALRPRRSTAEELEAWAARLGRARRARECRLRTRGRRGVCRRGLLRAG